jgi:GTP-binding protein EngB required for normal cell division
VTPVPGTGRRVAGGRARRDGVATVVEALDVVTALGPGRLDEGAVAEARSLRARIDARLARGDGATVVAVGGGTGVGKSALVNALLDAPVATVGVRRPTTAVPLAVSSEQADPVDALLDWLEIPERHTLDDLPAGLVLVDLPDHDSVRASHRRTAERLARRADVVVWVVDPVKYARLDAHAGPLAELTAHAGVRFVVLNRSDELPGPEAVADVRADLDRRLREGGHEDARVIVTSAVAGEGVDELRTVISEVVGRRTAAATRLVGDAAVLGDRLGAGLEELPELDLGPERLLHPLLEAVEADRVTVEAAQLTRRDALRRARSPLARVASAPVVRVARAFGADRSTTPPQLGPPVAATRERIERAVARSLGTATAVGRTHASLDRAVVDASGAATPDLLDAVARAGPTPPRTRWPLVLAALRAAAEGTALVGALWLTALAVVAWLQLPPLPTPDAVGAVPWPTALLLGGLAVRIVLGLLTRVLAARAGRRHGRRVGRRIRRAVRTLAEDHLLAPVREELAAQERLRRSVATLRDAA